jgi:DNA replication protein DnaC
MNNQSTIEKMQHMKLYGMVRAFKSTMEAGGLKASFTPDEMLSHLIDAEWDDRYNRKITRLVRDAHFRYQASIEQIDFQLSRNLDKNEILRFSDCSWIRDRQDIIITGPTGAGKSFLATALAHQGCIYGFKVLYVNCAKLFQELKISKADGTYLKELAKIQNQAVLVIDDFGLHPFDPQMRLSLLEIMEDRHGKSSTLIASQFPVPAWHDIIGEPTIADAICDRIIHHAHRIELAGESLRKKYPQS